MTEVYRDIWGDEIHKAHTNRHHLIFRERDYQTPTEKRFRGLGSFLIRMTVVSHRELHEAVKPPRKPSKNLMSEMIRLQDPLADREPLERLNIAIDYLDGLSNPQRHEYTMSQEAEDLMENLIRQRTFINLGHVVLLDE